VAGGIDHWRSVEARRAHPCSQAAGADAALWAAIRRGRCGAAAIPTGWELVLDLIRKLAATIGEDVLNEPELWFKTRFGKNADYADLLRELTQTAAERTQFLRSYFEPTEEERSQGKNLRTSQQRRGLISNPLRIHRMEVETSHFT
jgi:hypothetical protein